MAKPTAKQNDQELIKLKETILKAVFSNEPLPGSTTPIAFPDLPFILSQSDLYLLDETIKGPVFIKPINKTVRVVSLDFLRQIALQQGKAIYSQFRTTKLAQDRLSVRLETNVLSPDAGNRTAGLSSLRMEFQKVNQEWVLLDAPTALSA